MSDQKNQQFLRDPLNFIQNHAVDIRIFDRTVSGRPGWMPAQPQDSWFGMYGGAVCQVIREAHFDLEPFSAGYFFNQRNFCVLRFDRRTVTQQFLQVVRELRAQKAQDAFDNVQARRLAVQAAPNNAIAQTQLQMAEQRLQTFQASHRDRSDQFVQSQHPIPGYFFPYLSPPGGPPQVNSSRWGIPQMGFVDVPKQNPAHAFVFTGQMNGCALVFTDSPVGNTHFRVYHYPNVSSYPRFKTYLRWQGQRRKHVWTVEEYGTAQEPDAFNFLHHDGNHWYLYCQPQSQVVVSGNLTMQIRQKTVYGVQFPGRIRVTALGNQFLNAYI